MGNDLTLYPEHRWVCPFFYLSYDNGENNQACNILVMLHQQNKNKGDPPDCFGVDSEDCPLQQYSEVRVRAGCDVPDD